MEGTQPALTRDEEASAIAEAALASYERHMGDFDPGDSAGLFQKVALDLLDRRVIIVGPEA